MSTTSIFVFHSLITCNGNMLWMPGIAILCTLYSVSKCFYANVLRWGWINHCHFDVHMNLYVWFVSLLSMFNLCICVYIYEFRVCVCLSVCLCFEMFFDVCMNVCMWSIFEIYSIFALSFFVSPGRLWPKPKAMCRNFFDRILYHHQRRFCHKICTQTASFLGYCLREKKYLWFGCCCCRSFFFLHFIRAMHVFCLCLSVLTNGFGVFCIV